MLKRTLMLSVVMFAVVTLGCSTTQKWMAAGAGGGAAVGGLLGANVGILNAGEGALVGAVVHRLLDYGLRRYIGESASFINGAIYVAIVLFLPFGIVGTWKMRSFEVAKGWKLLMLLFGLDKKEGVE